jgi:hypothetical protein
MAAPYRAQQIRNFEIPLFYGNYNPEIKIPTPSHDVLGAALIPVAFGNRRNYTGPRLSDKTLFCTARARSRLRFPVKSIATSCRPTPYNKQPFTFNKASFQSIVLDTFTGRLFFNTIYMLRVSY